MATSSIEWTEVTWNPTVGCSKVSEGCRNCYAMRMAHRLGHNPKLGDEYVGLTKQTSQGPQWTRIVRVLPHRLEQPLRWRKPRVVFVNSMSDLFHEDVPSKFIGAVFAIMAASSAHTFQVLTKRPDRMAQWFRAYPASDFRLWALSALKTIAPKLHPLAEKRWAASTSWPLPNVWLGTSIEDERVRTRLDLLRESPAIVRFLSLEPLLGPLPNLDLRGIHWVIVGGESGPGARDMPKPWVMDIRDQCKQGGVPFFFKQWGGVRKKENGRELDGKKWSELPKAVALSV